MAYIVKQNWFTHNWRVYLKSSNGTLEWKATFRYAYDAIAYARELNESMWDSYDYPSDNALSA